MTVILITAENGYYYSLPTRILLPSRVKMVDYEVTISTAYHDDAGTSDNVFIKLMGFEKSSEHKKLKGGSSFARGAVSLKYPSLCLNV